MYVTCVTWQVAVRGESRVRPLEGMTRELLLRHVKQKPSSSPHHDEDAAFENCLVHVCEFLCMSFSDSWDSDLAGPCTPSPPKIKNIKTLKEEIWNLKKLSAILFYGGVDMSAQWDPTSNKDQHFFHCFSFWWRWAWFKDQKKSKIASKFWYIYGSVTFFCLISFFPFFTASLLHLCKSLHR